MNNKDLAIGVLSTTAVILFVGLILLNNQPPAQASGMVDRGGDYIALSGSLREQEEMLYLFNTADNKMMIYRFDRNTNQVVPIGPADLTQYLNGETVPAPGGKPPKKKP